MSRAVFFVVCVVCVSCGVGVDALKLPAGAPAAAASRRRLLAGAPAVAAAALVGGAGAAVAGAEADFKAADANRNGRLSRDEFERWYAGDARLTRQPPGPTLSLPEIALDVTGVSGIVAAIYAGSYAYYLTRQMAEKDAKAAKQKARDAQVKKADAAKAKAAAAAAAKAAEAAP